MHAFSTQTYTEAQLMGGNIECQVPNQDQQSCLISHNHQILSYGQPFSGSYQFSASYGQNELLTEENCQLTKKINIKQLEKHMEITSRRQQMKQNFLCMLSQNISEKKPHPSASLLGKRAASK
jgi:hypothetical protein